MSLLTYIASDFPIPQSDLLWPLSLGGEDIYTEKKYVAEVVPDLDNMESLVDYLQMLSDGHREIEVWRIWQGVEYCPVIRSREIKMNELTAEDLEELKAKDVANETTTAYGIPVQYRMILITE